jgi:hypothetical protein
MFLVAFGVAFLRPDHRFQSILTPLTRRLAATSGLLIFNDGVSGFPDLALPYNFAMAAILCWYWWGFISQHLLALDAPVRRRGAVMEPAAHTISDAEPHY